MLRSRTFLRGAPALNTDAAGFAQPDAFGPFRVLHQIGAGALGPVFRAYHPEQDRLVAVKLFRLDLAPERVHRLVAELEQLIVADLTHPAIAAPVAAGISDVYAYLAQDFVAADSLDIVVRDAGPTKPADAVRLIGQLASALDMAADAGVFHGSLHPRDVLVSSDDVRMTGLGIAQALERAGAVPPIRRPYTAPERVTGGPGDRRSDVFSLAALAFELLTARKIAGPGEPPADAFQVVPSASRQALGRVFGRALESEPGDRFARAGDFAKALETALETRAAAPGRTGSRRKAVEPSPPAPVLPPLPAEELPLLTDAMLTSDVVDPTPQAAPPAVVAEPPPVASTPDLAIAVEHAIEIDPMADNLRLTGRDPEPDIEFNLPAEPPEKTVQFDLVEPRRDGVPRLEREPDVPFEAMAEASKSAVWPLVLALVVGIAIGFGSATLFLGGRQSVVGSTSEPAGRPTPTAIVDEPIRPIGQSTSGSAGTPGASSPAEAAPAAAAPSAPVVAPPSVPVPSPSSTPPAGARVPRPRPAAPAATAAQEIKRTPPKAPAPSRGPVERASAGTKAPVSEPRTGPGSLVVESRPAGAEVFLDGKSVGSTPLVLAATAPGDHAISLQLAGYRRWATSVRITSGERSRVAASLDR